MRSRSADSPDSQQAQVPVDVTSPEQETEEKDRKTCHRGNSGRSTLNKQVALLDGNSGTGGRTEDHGPAPVDGKTNPHRVHLARHHPQDGLISVPETTEEEETAPGIRTARRISSSDAFTR